MSIEQAVIERMNTLPLDKKQEVLDFVEFLQARFLKPKSAEAAQEVPISALEAAGDLVGCVEGPGDLSTNKKYMEGFGQS